MTLVFRHLWPLDWLVTLMLIHAQNLDIDMEILYSLRHTVTWIIPSLMDIMRVEISARGTTRRTGSPRKNVTISVHVSYKVHYFICILWCLGPMCSVEWILLKYAIRQRCLACSIIILHREYTYLENNVLIICINNTSKSETEKFNFEKVHQGKVFLNLWWNQSQNIFIN